MPFYWNPKINPSDLPLYEPKRYDNSHIPNIKVTYRKNKDIIDNQNIKYKLKPGKPYIKKYPLTRRNEDPIQLEVEFDHPHKPQDITQITSYKLYKEHDFK